MGYFRDDAYSRADRRRDAHDAAWARLHQLGRAQGPWPLDVVALARQRGYRVRAWASGLSPTGRHGLILPATREIWIRANDALPVQRLSVGHELGHEDLRLDASEDECNAYAVGWCMPEAVVQPFLASWGPATAKGWAEREYQAGVLSQLVRTFGLGLAAVWVALADYG